MEKENRRSISSMFQFRLGTLTLVMMAAGPIIYCAYLFGPSLYDQLFPPLPAAYYLDDDIQYFPKGTEVELAKQKTKRYEQR